MSRLVFYEHVSGPEQDGHTLYPNEQSQAFKARLDRAVKRAQERSEHVEIQYGGSSSAQGSGGWMSVTFSALVVAYELASSDEAAGLTQREEAA